MLSRILRMFRHDIGGLLAGSAWIYGLRFAGAGFTFLTHLILARTIGPDALGQYVLAFSTATVIGFVCTLGLPAAAMRYLPMDLEAGRDGHAFGFLILSRKFVFITAIAVWAVATLIALAVFHDKPTLLWVHLFGAALIPVCAALTGLTDTGRALSMMTSTFAPNFIVRQLGLFLACGLLILIGVQLDAAWVTGITLATMVPLVLWQYRVTRRHALSVMRKAEPQYETRLWVTSALPLVFVFGATGFFLELNVTLAGQVLPAGELAVYNLAFQLVNLAGFALTAIDYQISPELSAHYGVRRMDAFDRLLRRATLIRTIVGIGIVIGIAVVGPWVLMAFGPQFELGLTALLILAATQVVAGVTGPAGEVHMFLGLERQGVVVSAISIVAAVVLTPVLVHWLGLEGAALSVLISTAIWEFGLLWVVWRNSGINTSILIWLQKPVPAEISSSHHAEQAP